MKTGDIIEGIEHGIQKQTSNPVAKLLNGHNYGLIAKGDHIAWVAGNKVVISVALTDLVDEGKGNTVNDAIEYIASNIINYYAQLNINKKTSSETSGE